MNKSIFLIKVLSWIIVISIKLTYCYTQPPATSNPDTKYANLYTDIIPVCDCEDLIEIDIPNTIIESAIKDNKTGSCQVTAIVTHPPANDRVKVWIYLPLNSWNGRFYGSGGAGFSGGNPRYLTGPVSQGFAAGATDTGHEGSSGSFALDTTNHRLNWQLIRDNGYLGIHDMTVTGKELVRAFYGKPARYSYFVGGSTGGRQGLMEAQRYPEDYNGIVCLCPGIHKSKYTMAWLWPYAVMNDANNYLSGEKLRAVTQAVISASDGDDGVLDGVINDPLNCKWDPIEFVGTEVGESTFTQADADVVRKIWDGLMAKDGSFLWYGPLRGTDLSELGITKKSALSDIRYYSGALDWCRYLLLANPKWDGQSITCGDLELLFNQSTDQYSTVYNPIDPDLTRFRNHGGRIIILHGLSDELVFPQGTIEYYNEVQGKMGGIEQTSKFARLFLVPGVNHGFQGAGPEPVGELEAVIRWVEEGVAPDLLNAESKDSTGKVIGTRQLPPYPIKAH